MAGKTFNTTQKDIYVEAFGRKTYFEDVSKFLAGNQLYELMSHRIGWCGCGPKNHIAIFAKNSDFWA